ncbi:protein-L-isoaspartate(D-aspartate) O-methyltransferase [Desulfopila sp. IMCC35006]|uniref:protein-L-isoaspartate(D-aspartate) O-methyltransferase n=1 Tax=Desulfopila sp. IMCC35006 TaxID=2569542 RepID=UPI0010ACC764|nr:protein-L-isoaspartate(D-aspartate) O-methyltransferase [Desulfopila sp. IMCC35006]TKB27388.1 protein-L-isoaspartate(D-aspartate) O-methyltransferase [Desulfopila sp. IMCC35006]
MGQPQINALLRKIEADCRNTSRYTGIEVFQAKVMQAIASVPREEFVPDHLKPYAYDNNPLPIGEGQTISQPYIVALMTDLLCPNKDQIILEAGTGSGYQAAVLSLLVKKVYSLEIVPSLAQKAKQLLWDLGYHNVEIRQGDASLGWQHHAPFDGIIVTAAAEQIPPALIEQLRPGGRLVIPVGYPHMTQELLLVEKDAAGGITQRNILPVAFVPFTGASNCAGNQE